jgi:hypothetical protein
MTQTAVQEDDRAPAPEACVTDARAIVNDMALLRWRRQLCTVRFEPFEVIVDHGATSFATLAHALPFAPAASIPNWSEVPRIPAVFAALHDTVGWARKSRGMSAADARAYAIRQDRSRKQRARVEWKQKARQDRLRVPDVAYWSEWELQRYRGLRSFTAACDCGLLDKALAARIADAARDRRESATASRKP